MKRKRSPTQRIAPRRVGEQREDRRRDGRQPRADVRDHLDERRPQAEEERVLLRALDEPRHAEDVHADAGARADDRREDRLPLEVAPERALDPLGERRAAVRREARVDRALEPLHVEEHVDRDDDDQDQREHEEDERERGALRERDRVLGVAGDLAGAQRVEPVVHLLADLDLLEAVVVEPRLEAVDVQLRGRLARSRAPR